MINVTTDRVMITLLVLLVAAIVYSIVRQQRDASSSFNLFDLLMYHGKLSHAYVFATGGWVIHSWLIVFWALQGTVKSDDMLIYSGIWVAPVMAWIFKGGSGDPPSPPTSKENPTDGNKS